MELLEKLNVVTRAYPASAVPTESCLCSGAVVCPRLTVFGEILEPVRRLRVNVVCPRLTVFGEILEPVRHLRVNVSIVLAVYDGIINCKLLFRVFLYHLFLKYRSLNVILFLHS